MKDKYFTKQKDKEVGINSYCPYLKGNSRAFWCFYSNFNNCWQNCNESCNYDYHVQFEKI